MGVFQSKVHEFIQCMKTMGAEIEYYRHQQSFYYLEKKYWLC